MPLSENYPTHLYRKLLQAKHEGFLKESKKSKLGIDFASTDYLGFSKNELIRLHQEIIATNNSNENDNQHIIDAEKQIALFHHAPSALIYNSEYSACVGIMSCINQQTDLVLFDECINTFLLDGIRLGGATHYKFKHNDVEVLEELILKNKKNYENIFIVVESVYSLLGDNAPLLEIVELSRRDKNIFLIVDESHALGVFGKQGRGLCNALGIENKCWARIYSYENAFACQGAAILGNEVLKNYLYNFSRSLAHTQSLPNYSLSAILRAYKLVIETNQKDSLQNNIAYFYSKTSNLRNLINNQSVLHYLAPSSNDLLQVMLKEFSSYQIDVAIINSYKQSVNRIRVCIHSFNTKQEIDVLVNVLSQFKK